LRSNFTDFAFRNFEINQTDFDIESNQCRHKIVSSEL